MDLRLTTPGQRDFQDPALELDKNNCSTAGKAVRLIAPAQGYAENRVLLIYVGEPEVAIRCGGLVEQAPGFDCFEFASS